MLSEREEIMKALLNGAEMEEVLAKLSNFYGREIVAKALVKASQPETKEEPKVQLVETLSEETINICKKVIPPSQFKFTMELTEGEEKEFFISKLNEIADIYKRIHSDKELVNADGTHTVGFRYFLGNTEIYLSEIDSDGIGFGYNILNGDLDMSEWGSTSLEEILKVPYMEMDYHVPKGATIEELLYQGHPDYFTEYAPTNKSETSKKFAAIIEDVFLTLSPEDIEAGTTQEQKNTRYNKWYASMVNEIAAQISADEDVRKKIDEFSTDKESHVEGNKWYSPDKAYSRDVQYKFLPELYEIIQNKIKARLDELKTPYVIMYSSESPNFPTENKIYLLEEFNDLLLKTDKEFHNRKKYAEEKYGSADNYWDLERDDKLPEEDKGIQFGYDKTNFKFFNIPSLKNPEDTLSYEPSRYDIGDGNGSVFDYIRSTCSYDELIEALNALETKLYFNVTQSQVKTVTDICKKGSAKLEKDLVEAMAQLDNAQHDYKELHKKWFIESTEAERIDSILKDAVENIKNIYEKSVKSMFRKVCKMFPIFEGDDFKPYVVSEIKRVVVSSLYKVSRDAQKAMNAEDFKTYNSVDWAKYRRIWEMFPANCNMDEYIAELCK